MEMDRMEREVRVRVSPGRVSPVRDLDAARYVS